MRVFAKHAFVHDGHSPNRGDEIDVSDALAAELEKRGLVERVKMNRKPVNKMASSPKNKSKAK